MKIVRSADGEIVAFGPEDDNYQPKLADGQKLEVGDVVIDTKPSRDPLTIEMIARAGVSGDWSEVAGLLKASGVKNERSK